MNYICTWLCIDEKGEESVFPQTGMLSSSAQHQAVYWRCVLLFFVTSLRFNKKEKHVLFTNAKQLPSVDGISLHEVLKDLNVEVVLTNFNYKTPNGYYGKFQNQFYEFSILEHIAKLRHQEKDLYLILDSDCIFIKPVWQLFNAAAPTGFISFEDDVRADYIINGLSRNDLRQLYSELLNKDVQELPSYHLGEFLLCSAANIRKIFSDFQELWPELLHRHHAGIMKFNEEAHTLSYLYFRNGFRAAKHNPYIKRIWTNPLFYRNVSSTDPELCIWHLPSEKTFGLYRLYRHFMRLPRYGMDITHSHYTRLVQASLGIPNLSMRRRISYYTQSYYRALRKRLKV